MKGPFQKKPIPGHMMVPGMFIGGGVSHPLEPLHQSSVAFTVAYPCCLDKLTLPRFSGVWKRRMRTL